MPQHNHTPTRICPDCSGHATAHIATGVRLRDGSRATVPVACPTCHGAGTVARPLALSRRPSDMALLDWRDARHWSPKPAPCGICDKATNLRSDRGKPVHKVCAEQWTEQHQKPADQS